MYKSIKQSYVSEHIIIQEKKSSFAINSWQLSIKEELINIADIGEVFMISQNLKMILYVNPWMV